MILNLYLDDLTNIGYLGLRGFGVTFSCIFGNSII